MKLPLSLRDRAGSTGNALNAAKIVSCPARGATVSDRIRDSGKKPLRGDVIESLGAVAVGDVADPAGRGGVHGEEAGGEHQHAGQGHPEVGAGGDEHADEHECRRGEHDSAAAEAGHVGAGPGGGPGRAMVSEAFIVGWGVRERSMRECGPVKLRQCFSC